MASPLPPGELRFVDTYTSDASGPYKLLLLTPELDKEVEAGHILDVKVSATEPAVLCTADRTFALQQVETSNACLLSVPAACTGGGRWGTVPPQLPTAAAAVPVDTSGDAAAAFTSVGIVASVSRHLEAVPTAPRLHKLRALLQEHPFSGPDDDDDAQDTLVVVGDHTAQVDDGGEEPPRSSTAKGHTTAELEAVVQCSSAELAAGLADAQALEVDGRWRVLDWEYQASVMDLVLARVMEMDHPLAAVPINDCILALPMFPAAVVRHCMTSCYGRAKAKASGAAGDGDAGGAATPDTACLDEGRVCLFRAEQVLRQPRDDALPVDEFQRLWEEALPTVGMKADVATLQGHVLIDAPPEGSTAAATIRHFPAPALSPDPAARFRQLFDVRPRWKLDDLLPFLMPLVGPGQSKDDLLLSHTRSTLQPDGSRLFSKR